MFRMKYKKTGLYHKSLIVILGNKVEPVLSLTKERIWGEGYIINTYLLRNYLTPPPQIPHPILPIVFF